MSTHLAQKARANRSAAIRSLAAQRAKIVSLNDYRLQTSGRGPLAASGATSIRVNPPNGAAA